MQPRPRDRRDDIIAAAEGVFAADGFDKATMRRIAAAADVQLSLVVYHFGTKLGLYQAVFERRRAVNDERLRELRRVDPAAPDAIERIVDAFLGPSLSDLASVGGSAYAQLVLREASDPGAEERGVVADVFDPMAREFIAALRAARPEAPPTFHHWAYLFCVGALTTTGSQVRAARLAGKADVGDRTVALRAFLVAGLRAE